TGAETVRELFAEELGAVLQVPANRSGEALSVLRDAGLDGCSRVIGEVVDADVVRFSRGAAVVFEATRTDLRRAWSETTWRMQALRDNPDCADEEYARMTDAHDPGMHVKLAFDPAVDVAAPFVHGAAKPTVAILREQGVNSQVEMAAAFSRAGFVPFDVHM